MKAGKVAADAKWHVLDSMQAMLANFGKPKDQKDDESLVVDYLSVDMRKRRIATEAALDKYNGDVLVEDERVTIECAEAFERARSAAHRAKICIVEA